MARIRLVSTVRRPQAPLLGAHPFRWYLDSCLPSQTLSLLYHSRCTVRTCRTSFSTRSRIAGMPRVWYGALQAQTTSIESHNYGTTGPVWKASPLTVQACPRPGNFDTLMSACTGMHLRCPSTVVCQTLRLGSLAWGSMRSVAVVGRRNSWRHTVRDVQQQAPTVHFATPSYLSFSLTARRIG